MKELPDDLFDLAAALVDIPSQSRKEGRLAGILEADLRSCSHLDVLRVGDSVVARTGLGRAERVCLAGHMDTVRPAGNERARVEEGTLWGVGSVDMKGGIAVLLDLARTVEEPVVDLTYVFYACEEIDHSENALGRIAVESPEVIAADAAVLCEPTGGVVQAGCQGTMRARVRLGGRPAHTARPWMGRNAIHRMAPLLALLGSYDSRRVELDGCEYADQLQAVRVEGGVAGNVVPGEAELTLNYRFAPDRSEAEAEAELRRLLSPVLDEVIGDRVEVLDIAPGAPPFLRHPLIAKLVGATGRPPEAKVGWTDVATFFAAGVPAANFGPGDPSLAHSPDEHVSEAELAEARRVLAALISA